MCNFEGPDFTVLQKSPRRFISLMPGPCHMGREVFDYWVDILKEHFPDLHKCMTSERPDWRREDFPDRYKHADSKSPEWRPVEPSVRELLEASLPVLSFLQKMQQKRRVIFGDEVRRLDWPCLCLVFEYHLRREFSLESEECKRRISLYYGYRESRILREDDLKNIVTGFWGYVLEFINGLGAEYLYHELSGTLFGYDRCAGAAVGLFTHTYLLGTRQPIPGPDQWKYVSTDRIPQNRKYRGNPPMEELV
ncbi:MAG: hypothetical protein WBC47_04875 [Dehalococcoidia bacterium]